MKTAVIIPNYNGAEMLTKCLESLAAQTRPPDSIIVVDNGSADGSAEAAENHSCRPLVIRLGENTGFARAANQGILNSDADLIALLNNDAEAMPGWMEAGIAAARSHPLVYLFASLMLDKKDPSLVDSAGDVYCRDGRPRPRGRGKPAAMYSEESEVISPCAGAAFYRRALFEEAGLFEEGFFSYLEDVDLGLRARARGHACLFVPGARVLHTGAATHLGDRQGKKNVDSAKRVRWIARNRIRVVARNWPSGFMIIWMPLLLLGLVRSAAYHVLVSRQGRPFFSGIMDGLKMFAADRAYFKKDRNKKSFQETARIMRQGGGPWQ